MRGSTGTPIEYIGKGLEAFIEDGMQNPMFKLTRFFFPLRLVLSRSPTWRGSSLVGQGIAPYKKPKAKAWRRGAKSHSLDTPMLRRFSVKTSLDLTYTS